MGFVEPISSNKQNLELEENNENSQQNAGSETGIQEKTLYSTNKRNKDEDTERQEENPVTISKETPDQRNERDKQFGDLPAPATLETTSSAGKVQSGEKSLEDVSWLPGTPRKNVIPPRRTSFELVQRPSRASQKTSLSSDGPQQHTFNQQPATNELLAHNSEAQVVQASAPGKENAEPLSRTTIESTSVPFPGVVPEAPLIAPPSREPTSVPSLEARSEAPLIVRLSQEHTSTSSLEDDTEPHLTALPVSRQTSIPFPETVSETPLIASPAREHTPVPSLENMPEAPLIAPPSRESTPIPSLENMPEAPFAALPPRGYTPVPWSDNSFAGQPVPMPGSWSKSQPAPMPRAWSEGTLIDYTNTQNNEHEPSYARQQKQLSGAVIEQTAAIETQKLSVAEDRSMFLELPTTPLIVARSASPVGQGKARLTRGWAICLALLLIIVIINATTLGFNQFFGPQGWGSVFNTSNGNNGSNLLNQISNQLHTTPTPGITPTATAAPTPQQIITALLAHMTLEQKIGQMLMVRFNGQDYSPQLNTMITQYYVGSVIEYQTNIGNKSQLISLNSQIQQSADLPMIISTDQEGGTVDRLVDLDGAQPSATSIGNSGDTNKAYQQGLTDAQDLASYGFNLNLAPVVDVNNVYNSQLYLRTYGTTAASVTAMAGAYLRGLQQSNKVLGTLKHFPGLGDTSTDPHTGLPYLTRSLSELNAIDWAPYKNLISQGNVYSIMVTHEIVKALDTTTPSSLSPKVVGILRNQLHFNGVIITDGLTMDAIINRYTLGQAATMAIEAGDDLLMDPGSPNEVAQMVDAIKQAISSGAITEQRIDESVSRILLFKYQMGLLNVNA